MKIPAFSVFEWILAILAILIIGVSLWNFDPFGRRERAEENAAIAAVQGGVDSAVAVVTADVAEDTAHIHRKAQEVTDALDASTDMDGDLAIWSAGIDRVLDGSERPSDQAQRQPDERGS